MRYSEYLNEALPIASNRARPKRPAKSGRVGEQVITEISEDRRSRRRFDLDLEVTYKIISRHQVCYTGAGKTINMSGSGLALATGNVLERGTTVELSVAWPVLLNKTCPLKLVITGKVSRSDRSMTAVRMERYEFRTQGLRALRTMSVGHSI